MTKRPETRILRNRDTPRQSEHPAGHQAADSLAPAVTPFWPAVALGKSGSFKPWPSPLWQGVQ